MKQRHFFFRQPAQVLAHRGDSLFFPENTMPAFESAAALGVDVIETDLHLTRDGHCVVWHDPHVSRTTNGDGLIAETDWADLASLDAGYHFQPPGVGAEDFPFRGKGIGMVPFQELLHTLPQSRFNIDIKSADPRLTREFIRIIGEEKAQHRVTAASFLDGPIRIIRSELPEIATSLPRGQMNRLWIFYRLGLLGPLTGLKVWGHEASLLGETAPLPEFHKGLRILSPAYIRQLQKRGIQVQVWTINKKEEMNRFLDWGVDGIFTDDPRLLQQVLSEREG